MSQILGAFAGFHLFESRLRVTYTSLFCFGVSPVFFLLNKFHCGFRKVCEIVLSSQDNRTGFILGTKKMFHTSWLFECLRLDKKVWDSLCYTKGSRASLSTTTAHTVNHLSFLSSLSLFIAYIHVEASGCQFRICQGLHEQITQGPVLGNRLVIQTPRGMQNHFLRLVSEVFREAGFDYTGF
ncbi:hypothetical protein CROQUDRAFT_532597 [Cronartium quercuum f. sp. fusiforme G11]|uniref:Uncharacterized protein n=1 Tax=Cronartium quercuum f. sp. fusiforme G11 TaxID=708437 RepID=A0A9P6NL18_9BASI|nr:hypothetical protein CROQUDRAFT_532597 [Cronartium quercuum f. sp. fusiforme G11]